MDWMSEDYNTLVTGIFLGIAFYNSLELFTFIFHTFQRNEGLYFWSMLLSTAGVLTHTIGVIMSITINPGCPVSIVVAVGWFAMVVGQTVVLYSRLHLVVLEPRKILWILVMMITVAALIVTPLGVLYIDISIQPDALPKLWTVAELGLRVQSIASTLQDSIISGLYVYEARQALKMIDPIKGPRVRAMNRNLVALFILCVTLGIVLLATVFIPMPKLHAVFKPFVYSVNLKVEALVLNNLVSLIKSSSSSIWDLSTTNRERLSVRRNLPRSPTIGRRPSFVRSPTFQAFQSSPADPKNSNRDTMDTVALMDVTKWGVYSRRPTFSETVLE